MQRLFFVLFALCALLCTQVSASFIVSNKAVKVEIKKTGKGFQMLRGGHPYFIKGGGGTSNFSTLASYGGNSVRTWGTQNAQAILDSAYKNGLTVMLGLNVTAERHGFNYSDPAAVKKQFDKVKADVLKYKDHPALLTWGIGNELNLFYKNPAVWDAVNDIAKMIRELDPNHPPTTVLAGITKKEVDEIKEQAPSIELISINTYGGLATLPNTVKASGWTGPYLVTEWGPTGHWEGLKTEWDAPVEETSSEKAAVYQSRYRYSVQKDNATCLGSYVFLWGQKQERTPTWYGLFTPNGEISEVGDVMHFLWKGRFPSNKAPRVYGFTLDDKTANQSVYVKPSQSYVAEATAADLDGDTLNYRWELLPEATEVGEGGDHEDKPKAIETSMEVEANGRVKFAVPQKVGAYRLFVYISDGKNKVATANIPFYVKN
jgi:hypothetical protein